MDKTTKKVLAGQIIGVAQDVKQVDGVGQVVTVAMYGFASADGKVVSHPKTMQFCGDNNVSLGDAVMLNDKGGVEALSPKSKEQSFAEKALQQLGEDGWSADLQKADWTTGEDSFMFKQEHCNDFTDTKPPSNPSVHTVGHSTEPAPEVVPPIPPGMVIDEMSPLSMSDVMEMYENMPKLPKEGTITVTYDRPKDEVVLFEVMKGLMDKKCFKNIDIRTESEDHSPNVKLKVEIDFDVMHNAMASAIFKMLRSEDYPHKHHNKPKIYMPKTGKPTIHLLKRLVRTNAEQEGETGAAA